MHLLPSQEFIRVGYYVNNEYGTELRENPPVKPDFSGNIPFHYSLCSLYYTIF